MNEYKQLIDTLKEMAGKAQFVSFTYLSKGHDELARHTLIFGASYRKQIEDSITALEVLMPTFVTPLQIAAAEEVMKSLRLTIASHDRGEFNPDYTKKMAYIDIVQGLKFNITNRTINVSGLAHNKVVLKEGVYKPVKSSDLTLAKKDVRDKLPVSRWREFIIEPQHLEKAKLQGNIFVLNED